MIRYLSTEGRNCNALTTGITVHRAVSSLSAIDSSFFSCIASFMANDRLSISFTSVLAHPLNNRCSIYEGYS